MKIFQGQYFNQLLLCKSTFVSIKQELSKKIACRLDLVFIDVNSIPGSLVYGHGIQVIIPQLLLQADKFGILLNLMLARFLQTLFNECHWVLHRPKIVSEMRCAHAKPV